MNKEYLSHSLDDLPQLVGEILEDCVDSKIFVFYGNLGAGKTTLIKTLCHQLGYHSEVTSPTFSLVNHYKTPDIDIYHMDLYRLKDEEEALEIGIEEYLYSGAYCFIEWPQVIIPLIDEIYYKVQIETLENLSRKIDIEKCL
jgi:tRNA threonylcarbamoyladenosine biosynthesis protein TsaE